MASSIRLVGASVIGTDHRRSGLNNQDAFCITRFGEVTIALVADGCSDGKHHESGAQIGVRLVSQAILKHISDAALSGAQQLLEQVRQETLAYLRVLALGMGENLSEVVSNYFLFTLLGGILTPQRAVFFAIGDGVFIINNQQIVLGPFDQNMPPFLGYTITQRAFLQSPELLSFGIVADMPTGELERFLIGTDGVIDLLQSCNRTIPGKEELIGPIDRFFEEDMFANPHTATRRLNVINRDVVRVENGAYLGRDTGRLRDDTTFIAGKTLHERRDT